MDRDGKGDGDCPQSKARARPDFGTPRAGGIGEFSAEGGPGEGVGAIDTGPTCREVCRNDHGSGRVRLPAVAAVPMRMFSGDHALRTSMRPVLLPRTGCPGRARCGGGRRRVEGVVQLALSKYPNERFQSARELAMKFGEAIGVDIWAASSPPRRPKVGVESDDIVLCTLAPESTTKPSVDPFVLSDRFEAMMPDRLAAVKLRGFIEDVGGEAIASEPGLITVRIGTPPRYRELAEKATGSAR